ncbi:MAG: ABC transporter permease [Phycisphaerales bacterium]|nr:MAG: ABC transporter permease [Phycisphaerales bacterium]
MYHALLTNRYLTTRVIPLIAVAAVALCVALVIIVVSVMTGFLNMVKDSGRTLMGDVVVAYPISGIPYYDRLIERVEALEEAEAATPVVDSWGLMKMPYPDGPRKQTATVQIWGVDPESFARVTGYDETLYWRTLPDEEWQRRLDVAVSELWDELREQTERLGRVDDRPLVAKRGDDARTKLLDLMPRRQDGPQSLPESTPDLRENLRGLVGDDLWEYLVSLEPRLANLDQAYADGLSLHDRGRDRPGIVIGIEVSEGNERMPDGSYRPMRRGYWWMPQFEIVLTMVPIGVGGGLLEPESRFFRITNEFVSGVYLIDSKRVMIPIGIAQEMLQLDEAQLVDDEGQVTGIEPPRATMILIRAADGVTPEALRDKVSEVYRAFCTELANDESVPLSVLPPPEELGVTVLTWLQQQAQFIGPIEKERELMRTLFSLVYLVCAGLVLAIFWAIVYEKTRDIGILRSIGASRLGISWIFLRYGLVVGVLGSIVGLGLAYLIVHNINTIHTALGQPPLWLAVVLAAMALLALIATIVRSISGRLLPLVLGALITLTLIVLASLIYVLRSQGGVVIWDPTVYYFTEIPNELDLGSAWITMIGAVVFSLIGAFLPAAKAADTDPVKALRYE